MTTESHSISRRNFLTYLGAGAITAPTLARSASVKVGVCAKSVDIENAIHYGFDYLEASVAEISEMDESKFAAFKARVLASSIRCESFNSFIRTLRVVGDDVDHDALRKYLESSLERASQLGGSVVVWGSAGSRNLPAGYSRDVAWKQMKDFLRQAGEVAKSKSIVIAIEPLRKKESNILNTGAEVLRLVRETGHPNVKMIIDYYHLREENEDPQIVWEARNEIVHFHFANPNGRLWPKDASEDPLYGRFFELIKRIRFRGGISIEGHGTFANDAAASVEFFRRELA